MPFEAHFGRLPKTEFKILRDSFIKNSDRLDEEHLERSALTVTQLKKRVDQSRDNVKIVKKGQSSREVSPLFKTEVESARDRARAKALKTLLEANARCNETRRDISANGLRRVVEETSTINPDLWKELLYSWQYGFIEDKPQAGERSGLPNLLRKDDNRKSWKALTNPLKGKEQSETPYTVKSTAGAVFGKSDIAKAKVDTSEQKENNSKKETQIETSLKLNPRKRQMTSLKKAHGDEPKTKSKKKANDKQQANIDSDAIPDSPEKSTNAETLFQDSDFNITSRDTEVNGGLNLSVKRAKPSNAGPVVENSISVVPKGTKQSNKKQTCQESRRQKAAASALEANQSNTKDKSSMSSTAEAVIPSTSTPKKTNEDSKDITRNTPADKILKSFQSRDLTTIEWNKLADQVLTRGVLKAAEDFLKSSDRESEVNIYAPPGFLDESGDSDATVRRSERTTKNKGPSRYGNPYKHSVKLVSSNQDLIDLNRAALEAYRIKLASFRTDVNKPEETNLSLLEKHLFRRKFIDAVILLST